MDWARFGLVVLRSTWDYAERRDAFLAWARALPRVLNPRPGARVEHRQAAVPQRSRRRRGPGRADRVRRAGRGVLAAGRRVRREAGDLRRRSQLGAVRRRRRSRRATRRSDPRRRAHGDGAARSGRHHRDRPRLHRRLVLARSLAPRAAARRRRPRGLLPRRGAGRGGGDAPRPRGRRRALACAPDELLYGRVDLVDGAVLELEITEPSLYLGFGQRAAAAFAAAIATRL